MIIILNTKVKSEEIDKLILDINKIGIEVHVTGGENKVLVLMGDIDKINPEKFEAYKCVEKVVPVKEPFKKVNRLFKQDNSVFNVKGVEVGGNKVFFIAGPCSVESAEQIVQIAKDVKAMGASFLRGGAFKPRTSPYSFQGLELEGLELLKIARKETGLPIVTEIMSTNMLDKFVDDVDIIQVGARNMQNFDLLKELGKVKVPILLKRGLSATIEEFLMSAEYIMAGGNEEVILCERGIRTFETYTRNTLDLSSIPIIKKLSHLPVIVDPSHATGKSWLVEPLSKGAIAVGADGLIIEVHNNPATALCDGQQSISPTEYESLSKDLKLITNAVGREI